ncbi:hypothetical protein HK100_003594 [Physocladia obscura]|uniref:CRIB domain-containing protein n=1 Tax=Physocladia obscura TaxID=109957 RepID=A0AAD5T7L6_9FUNG|nr:hypothetical protein HK100_003594 [Physocladia obscura]
MSLNGSEANIVAQAVGGSETLISVAARLYLADESRGEWRLEHTGAAVVVNGRSSVQVLIVDLKSRRTVFTTDAGGSEWRYYKDKLGISQRDRCFAALSFADESEASEFADILHDAIKAFTRASMTAKISVNSAAATSSFAPQSPSHSQQRASLVLPPTVIKSISAPMGVGAPATPVSLSEKKPAKDDSDVKKSEGGFFSSFGRKKTESTNEKKEKKSKGKSKNAVSSKIDKSMISAPSNFEHVSHVGFNQNTGFTAQNIPMEWKAIFAKAGITEEQLADKHTAKFVKKFMKENSGAGGMPAVSASTASGGARRAPPPPPPSRRAPPPPPPTRSSAGPSTTSRFDAPPTVSRYDPPPPAPARYEPPPAPARYDPPPVPFRNEPPPAPARQAPSPPVRPDIPSYNSRNTTSSVSVPPPRVPPRNEPNYASAPLAPPTPSFVGGAPPPPPPPPPTGFVLPSVAPQAATPPAPPARSVATNNGGGGGLPGGGAPASLLDAIRNAGGVNALKPSASRADPPPMAQNNSSGGGGTDLAEALRLALLKKRTVESDSEESDDDDEGEW